MNKYFILFANCIPVNGKKNSIICDLQNHYFIDIPSLLYGILITNREENLTVYDLKKKYNNEQDEGIDLFFGFLIEKGMGFYSNSKEKFPPLNMKWSYPGEIANSIIEVSDKILPYLDNIAAELSGFNCFGLELRVQEQVSLDVLHKILQAFDSSSLKFILLMVHDSENITLENYEAILEQFPRCANVFICSSDTNRRENKIIYIKEDMTDRKNCGLLNKESFLMNVKSFTEAVNYNSCLNKKISIDKEGEIKNCPSLSKSYGNIKETTLLKALKDPEFKNLWSLNKDKVHVCQDCEFRYICTDCRAYVENPQDIYSKPLKCGYNPYSGEWTKWSNNPLKQEAIKYYNMETSTKLSP